MTSWRPTMVFDRQVSREMTVFGAHIVMVGLFGALQDNVDYLLVGRILGATALGYYTLAYRIPELIIRNFNYVVSRVAHPLLSQLQSDISQLRSIYFGYVRYIALLTFPAGVGLALISPLFFRTFFKAEWEPAIFLMQMIALALAIGSISFVPGVLYKAINRPEILNYIAMARLPITITTLWLSARWWGTPGVATAQLGLALVNIIFESVIVSRIVKFSLREMVHSLAPAVAGSAVMALALSLAATLLPASGVVSLIALIVVGIISYGGMLMLVGRDTMVQAQTVLRGTFSRS
jgi:O-antigen/teichoic acid export membrane protein